tara:strand:- start:1959 stop:3722 length:1764 start_codon:yes stop_codon:yes gene_type:complete
MINDNKFYKLKNEIDFIYKLNDYNSINDNGILNKTIQKKYNLLFNNLLPQISYALNKLHKVNKPNYYWQIILSNWFHYFLTIIVHRDHFIEYLIKEKSIIEDHRKSKVNFNPSYDFVDFYRNTNSIKWNETLIYQLIHFKNNSISLNKIELSTENIIKDNNFKKNKLYFLSIKSLIRRTIELFIRFIPRRKKYALLLFPWRFHWIHLIFLYVLSFGKIIPHSRSLEKKLFCEANLKCSASKELRIKFFNYLLENNNEYELEKKIISLNIPISIIENFEEINKASINFNKYYKTKLIISFGSHIDNELLKNAIAEYKLKNVNVVVSQHGNVPRLIYHKYHRDLETEYVVGNLYITWGWRFRKKDLPISGARLLNSKLRLKYYHLIHKKIKNRILYILSANKEWDFIKHTYYFFNHYKNRKNRRINFLKNVPSQICKSLIIRNYHYKPYDGLENKNDLKKISDSLKFSKKNIYYETAKSDILLFDSISTFNLEVMTINKPFLLLLEPNEFYLSYAGKIFFKNLEELSILHRNHESLINQILYLNKIGIDNWWRAILKNDKYKKILSTYANTNNDYFSKWISLVNSILIK